METKYAFGYVRVSTGKQDELSPDSQAKLLKDYAKSHGYVVSKIFYEVGISGRKADKRPEFQKMIGLAKASDHPADAILVWKYSRFARNQEESIVYKSLLKKKHNVDVISVSEPLVDGPFGSLIERIIEWMDEYYSIRLSGEVLRGMREKAEQNGYQFIPPLGYQAVGGGKPFVINENEYKIYQYIADEYDLRNSGISTIARKLNDLGLQTRRGRPFEMRSIRRLLQNPFYYGLVVWNGVSFVGTHEVRITKERFDARMQKMQSQYAPARRRDVSSCRHWLSGLLKCGYCGATMCFNGARSSTAGFQCYKYSKGLHKESCFITERKVLAAINEYFEKLLNGMDFEYTYHPPKSAELLSEREPLLQELKKIAMREERIRSAYENGIDTLEEYKRNKERIKQAKEDIQSQLDELNDSSAKPSVTKEDMLAKVRTVYDVIQDPDVDLETKGAFMRSLVEDIVYDKENGKMIFHLYAS